MTQIVNKGRHGNVSVQNIAACGDTGIQGLVTAGGHIPGVTVSGRQYRQVMSVESPAITVFSVAWATTARIGAGGSVCRICKYEQMICQ